MLTVRAFQLECFAMNGSMHDLRLFWVPGRVAPSPRSSSVNTENPDDIFAYQDEVTALETLREKLYEIAQTATGTIHELPQIEGAPKVIEKPWASIEAGQRYVAWNLFAVDPISGLEVQLSKRLENIGGGIMWVETLRSDREVVRNSPPPENIANGYKCEDCRRFSYEQGQEWLNQETHRFEKASAQMWRDVVELIAEKQDVEVPNSLEDFGACLEDSKLVAKFYPGCKKYKKRATWEGRACLPTGTTPGEENGGSRHGQ